MFRNQRMPIPSDSLPSVVENLFEFLKESVEILEAMYKEVDFEDREMEDARNEFEEAAGEEKDCVENLLDALGSIIRFAGNAIAPLDQQYISPFCAKYMASPFEYILFVGVCSMDDLMLYAPDVVAPVVNDLLGFFHQHMHCEDPALRQAVLFGVKVAIERFHAVVAPQAQAILSALLRVAQSQEAEDEKYASATDNALSAIFSLLLGCPGNLGPAQADQALQLFVSRLPLMEDVAEAQDVHERVVMELEKPNHGLFSNKNVMNAVMQALPMMLLPTYDDGDNEYEITYDETKMEIMKILKSLDRRQLNGLLNGLEPDMRMAVSSILNN